MSSRVEKQIYNSSDIADADNTDDICRVYKKNSELLIYSLI